MSDIEKLRCRLFGFAMRYHPLAQLFAGSEYWTNGRAFGDVLVNLKTRFLFRGHVPKWFKVGAVDEVTIGIDRMLEVGRYANNLNPHRSEPFKPPTIDNLAPPSRSRIGRAHLGA